MFRLDAAPPQPPPQAPPKSILEPARDHLKANRYKEAESLLLEILRIRPDGPDAAECKMLLGQAQMKQQRPDDALRTYAGLVQRHPETDWAAQAMEEQAKLYIQRRNPKAAQQLRDLLLERYPKSPTTAQVWMTLADDYYQAGQFKEAMAIYSKIAPYGTGAAKDRYETAKLMTQSGGDPQKLLAAGDAELKKNRREFAKTMYRMVADKKTAASTEARVKYAWCTYLEGGDENLKAAEKIWTNVAAQDPKSEWGSASRWHLVQLHAGPKHEWKKAVDMCAAISRDFAPGTFRHEQALYTRRGCCALTSSGRKPKPHLRN
jgi:TolA-binding protein